MKLHRLTGVQLYFLPVQTRVPLKFGLETVTSVTCARVALTGVDARGTSAQGWGETPLSVTWVWPGTTPYEYRHAVLKSFCERLAKAWLQTSAEGHPVEIGHHFQEQVLPGLWRETNRTREPRHEPMPWLAALVCCSAFDIALHDAFGKLVNQPVYLTYGPEFLSPDLTRFLEPAAGSGVSFAGRLFTDFFQPQKEARLTAWHLVGGLDLLEPSELTGNEPQDGYPVVLTDWIQTDGLKCLKIKLRGNDTEWDFQRLVKVGRIALASAVEWLSADFNCTVHDPDYVNAILDRLQRDFPAIHARILYVEQPFPYELEELKIEVGSVSARKPLFLDESAHDWRMIRLGRELGWTGVALKTCKTQTGALLSACWARAHGMSLMVQDLTNPMLAQIPHVLLAANVGTIMGVETNAMQFYPAVSAPEACVHPGLYRRREGCLDLSSLRGSGFGYRLNEISRILPPPAVSLQLD